MKQKNSKQHNAIANPHDAVFKKSLSRPEVAAQFVQRYLPKSILKQIQLDSLCLEPTSFIDPNLNTSISDLVFRFKTKTGKVGYLYFLVEHQRKPYRLMPFRLLKYLINVMDTHLQQHKTDQLPLVYPMVIYNGEQQYPYSMDLFELFDPSIRAEAKQTLFSPYALLDLSNSNMEEVNDDPWLGALFNAMKYGPSKRYPPKQLIKHLTLSFTKLAKTRQHDYISIIIRYINCVRASESRDELWQGFESILAPILGEEYMFTVADSFEQDGIQKGLLRGRLEGKLEGKLEGMQEGIREGMQRGVERGVTQGRLETKHQIAENLLRQGIATDLVANATGLSIDELKQTMLP